MSLRFKLLLTSTATILTVVALVACEGYGASAFERTLQDLAKTTSALRNHTNADMMHDALRSDVYAALYASTQAIERKDQIIADTARHAAQFSNLIAQNNALNLSGESELALRAVEEPLNAYIGKAQKLVLTVFSDASAAQVALPAFDDSFRALESAMEEAGDKLAGSAEAATKNADALSDITKRIAIVGLVIGLVVGALSIWTVLQSVLRPLSEITNVMQKLAGGDLGIELPSARNDEIGLMTQALLKFRDAEAEKRELETQAGIQREVAEKSRLTLESERAEREKQDLESWKAEDAAREAREAEKARDAQVVKSTMEILAANLNRLAQGDLECTIEKPFVPSFEQIRLDFNTAIHRLGTTVESIKEIAHVINEQTLQMESASDELASRTEQQAASLEESSAAATELSNAVNTTAESSLKTKDIISAAKMESVTGFEVVKQTTSAMTSVRESSQQITQIIGVVDEIAFQTNLLALNAGVEAARAGDAGRGFAVVATEVRALAQRSATAAKEIKNLISRSSNEVETSFQLVAQTGAAIERMMNQVSQIDRGIADIATRSIEQAGTLKQVNTAISEIDQSTQRNAVMAEHSTAACRTLAEETAHLRELLGTFKVRSGGRSGVVRSSQPPASYEPRNLQLSKKAIRA